MSKIAPRIGAALALAALSAPLLFPAMARAQALTAQDVQGIISRVVQEANAHAAPATIAIVDRMGRVLAVYQMEHAPTAAMVVNNPHGPNGGLNGALLPTTAEAIAKADTAAYLSTSYGNAFSTRTASEIIQDHFLPGTAYAPSGPLYGVQFSSLPCSDLAVRLSTDVTSWTRGPHRSPLGLAGDPGGLPLYKDGVLVGGIGVKAQNSYGIVLDTQSTAQYTDEILAYAGTYGLQAPLAIQADHIAVNGLLLRFSNAGPANLLTNPAAAPPYDTLPNALTTVIGYFVGPWGTLNGSAYGSVASGLVADTSGGINTADPPMLLLNSMGGVRYPITAGANSPGALTQAEVYQIMRSAYAVALETRAQLRPQGEHAAITISIVDVYGAVLGVASVPDAALFGVDVSLQKARSAAFLSSMNANAAMAGAGSPIAGFNAAANADFGRTAFNGGAGWSERTIGTIARDTLPDGINGTLNGPLSLAATPTTPFNDGLQLDLVLTNLGQHVKYMLGQAPDTPDYCTSLPPPPDAPTPKGSAAPVPVLADGLQVFAGGFPIYRNNTLVGGIGVSGDGVGQDDFVSFYGLYLAGLALHNGVGNAPASLRANNFAARGVRPVWVSCPTAPFLNSNQQNVCSGK